MISNSQVSFCVDTLLVETILGDSKFYKKAGFVSDLLDRVKEYFGSQIDTKHPVSSVLRVLAPGALWMFLSAIGLGKWGFLLGLLMDVFHIDAPGMLSSMFDKVKGMIGSGKKVSSEEIDSATEAVAQEHATPGSSQEVQQAPQAIQQLKDKHQEAAEANDHVTYSSLDLMHDAKLIRIALIDYENQYMRLNKQALFGISVSKFNSSKSKGSSLLATIFGWIVKIALFSAGLMVAGDIVNAVLGRPNGLTGGGQTEQESSSVPVPSGPKSTQTKFPPKGDAQLPSSWPLVNNPSNIDNMLIQFTKDVYSGLDGKESLIQNTPGFQMIKDKIDWYNARHPGSSAIFIPPNWETKKQLVDYFIDDVAKSVK